ncbi:hypothetical protein L195_g013596 [Trifolium pratense]|uniref:Uncharacterized protein n=1 Tax=Trifolium pratense TaxID=57577 RepID=A0A2K3PNK3_TRIPR|nr:hypothetical protein L195_g013596 [Trifolium pratense]
MCNRFNLSPKKRLIVVPKGVELQENATHGSSTLDGKHFVHEDEAIGAHVVPVQPHDKENEWVESLGDRKHAKQHQPL